MRRTALIACLLVCVLSLLGATPATGGSARKEGASRVVAKLPPAPGYPEGIGVWGHFVYVTTAARFGTCCLPPPGPPEVQVFDLHDGALVKSIAIADKTAGEDHGLSGVAFDAQGRLYVLDTQWGIVRFDPATAPPLLVPGPGTLYAPAFPNLLPCTPLSTGDCSPTALDAPPLPNDIVFTADGTAYVSDSLQATIWRIPKGGGAPQVWLQDASLDGFGPNGLRLSPDRNEIVMAVTLPVGAVYRIPLENPELHRIRLLPEAPDNLAFGASGRLYVALAGSNQIGVLSYPDGGDIARYSGPASGPDGPVLYDMPSGVAFNNRTKSLLANNHSEVLGLPDHFVVFDVYVKDTGDPLELPSIP